jgi:putative addiction module antidote
MHTAKVIKIGDSLGIVLPAGVVERLGLAPEQSLLLTETTTGFRLSKSDPELERQIRLGEAIMDEYRDTLRELAKGPD